MNRTVATLVGGSSPWEIYEMILSISYEGNVYTLGKNEKGCLGLEEEDIVIPKQIPTLKNIQAVSCGLHHSILLDHSGVVYTIGSNDRGQLGIGKDDLSFFTNIPQLVEFPESIKQISCTLQSTFCLSINGNVYSFGSNIDGVLGLGHNYPQYYISPQQIKTLQDGEFIECGILFTFCKTSKNQIYGWGNNEQGQLGVGDMNDYYRPALCNFPEDTIDIKCGYEHTLVLTSNQEVYSCGNNNFGQLGGSFNGTNSSELKKIETLKEIIRVECGFNHSLCIDRNNDLYVFGDNRFGQLGLGDNNQVLEPIKHPSLSNIIDISKGGDHTFVKTLSNEIYAFGKNYDSQLGIETEDNLSTPIRVFEDNEDIWCSNINKSKAKSARSIAK